MTEETKNTPPTDAPEVEQSQPVDAPVENAAHPVDEDPEQHMGDETNDPWDDETQTDWPGGVVNLPGVEN